MAGSAASGGWRSHSARYASADDVLHIAAPSTGRIQLSHISIMVESAGTTFLARLEDGEGGTSIASLAQADGSVALEPGECAPIELSDETGLNVETTGTAGAFIVTTVYRVKG